MNDNERIKTIHLLNMLSKYIGCKKVKADKRSDQEMIQLRDSAIYRVKKLLSNEDKQEEERVRINALHNDVSGKPNRSPSLKRMMDYINDNF